jgi:hypothetical protein
MIPAGRQFSTPRAMPARIASNGESLTVPRWRIELQSIHASSGLTELARTSPS